MIPFGTFTDRSLEFLFINTIAKIQRCDIGCFNSYELWHNVTSVVGDRQVVVLTSHQSVLQHFE